ncbi:MAG: hypothetical protein GQ574_01615 [Crocinitomix sp.]|nr:hypothetical protein [Crocinitomix sp.]
MIKYTADIYNILRRGQFICSNSPNEHEQKLYSILEEDEQFEEVYAFFYQINYTLEKGNEYFSFSRQENTVDLERKLEKAYGWIDLLDFFNTYDTAFDVGFRFSPAQIVSQLMINADLSEKLNGFKRIGTDKKNYTERINKLIERLVKEGYLALEDEVSETYKVLTAFHYLKQLVETINIPEDIDNEIPE